MPRRRQGVSIRRVWTLSTITLLTLTVVVALMLRSQMVAILGALDADDDRVALLQRDIEGRMQAMLNQEVGLRGFLATGDASFLEPYRIGRRDELRLRDKTVLDDLVREDRDELTHA